MAREKITKEEHYRRTLDAIIAIADDYDGYRTVDGLKGLIDDLAEISVNSLKLVPVYVTGDNEPAYEVIP